MADRRKLQGEIDRTLKKIDEGVEIFQDIWQKIQAATNINIKEKHEADLKKEIKKLQRLRDGIKTWLASSDIKDKETLLDYKKRIEVQMERFKVIERETKTKAYSKEGLGAAAKVDPREKEKEELTNWLSISIEELNKQIDQYETELESVVGKKKKLDRDKQDTVDDLRRHIEKHRFHIDQLETVMRLVNNDVLEIGLVLKIRDDIEYYLSSSKEPDFEENEFLYDDLHLEEACASLGKLTTPHDDNDSETSEPMNSSSPSPCPSLANTHKDNIEEEQSLTIAITTTTTTTTTTRTRLRSTNSNESRHQNGPSLVKTTTSSGAGSSSGVGSTVKHSTSTGSGSSQHTAHSLAKASHSFDRITPASFTSQDSITTSSCQNYAQAAAIHHHQQLSSSSMDKLTPIDPSKLFSPLQTSSLLGSESGGKSMVSGLTNISITQSPTALITSQPLASSQASANRPITVVCQSSSLISPSATMTTDEARTNGPIGGSNSNLQSNLIPSLATLKSIVSQESLEKSPPGGFTLGSGSSTSGPGAVGCMAKLPHSSVENSMADYQSWMNSLSGNGQQQTTTATTTIHLPPVLSVTPLGPQPMERLHIFQLAMLDAASMNLPQPDVSERIRAYFPRSPIVAPPYYTQVPSHVADSIDFFNRLGIETLFFIFYYMEGTKAQFLAAKALKLKSWRFHTKLLTWFQRHEEPKIITDEYEQGSYLYFDFEKWMQRQHDSFTFEYKYLEDHDLSAL